MIYLNAESAEFTNHFFPFLFQTFGSEGLQLVDHTEIVLFGQAVLQLTFDPGAFGRTRVTTRCHLDHPFYVKNKGGSDSDDDAIPNMVTKHSYSFFGGGCLFFFQAGHRFIPA